MISEDPPTMTGTERCLYGVYKVRFDRISPAISPLELIHVAGRLGDSTDGTCSEELNLLRLWYLGTFSRHQIQARVFWLGRGCQRPEQVPETLGRRGQNEGFKETPCDGTILITLGLVGRTRFTFGSAAGVL
jgi:hypothetical protein